MKNDTKNLRMDTMLHICEGFKITLKEFYDDKLFDDVCLNSKIPKLNKANFGIFLYFYTDFTFYVIYFEITIKFCYFS